MLTRGGSPRALRAGPCPQPIAPALSHCELIGTGEAGARGVRAAHCLPSSWFLERLASAVVLDSVCLSIDRRCMRTDTPQTSQRGGGASAQQGTARSSLLDFCGHRPDSQGRQERRAGESRNALCEGPGEDVRGCTDPR